VPQITKKDRPLTLRHFKEFEKCYGASRTAKAKRKSSDSKRGPLAFFHISEVKEREFQARRIQVGSGRIA